MMSDILTDIKRNPNLQWLKKTYRFFVPTDDERIISTQKKRTPDIISSYFKKEGKKKLYIGCQHQPIDGWLNVDILPGRPSVVYMDATKTFPFPGNSFDFIFCEHMIEHVKLEEGIFMLSECLRVLKPGGIMRIVTPDLNFLVKLFSEEKDELRVRYINSCKKYFPSLDFINEAMVLNNFMRNWGHQFVYDKPTLRFAIEKAGFDHIEECNVGESSFEELLDIEQHGKEIGDDFNKLESYVVEAHKKLVN